MLGSSHFRQSIRILFKKDTTFRNNDNRGGNVVKYHQRNSIITVSCHCVRLLLVCYGRGIQEEQRTFSDPSSESFDILVVFCCASLAATSHNKRGDSVSMCSQLDCGSMRTWWITCRLSSIVYPSPPNTAEKAWKDAENMGFAHGESFKTTNFWGVRERATHKNNHKQSQECSDGQKATVYNRYFWSTVLKTYRCQFLGASGCGLGKLEMLIKSHIDVGSVNVAVIDNKPTLLSNPMRRHS